MLVLCPRRWMVGRLIVDVVGSWADLRRGAVGEGGRGEVVLRCGILIVWVGVRAIAVDGVRVVR